MSSVYVVWIGHGVTHLKTPEFLWIQLGASIHEPLGRSSRQFVRLGVSSKREGAVSDEVGHNETSRCLLAIIGFLGSRGRVKRDRVRRVEVRGRLDGESNWEEEVLERNQESPERAENVVHLVESRRGANGEEPGCWKTR